MAGHARVQEPGGEHAAGEGTRQMISSAIERSTSTTVSLL